MKGLVPPSKGYNWPTLALDPNQVQNLHELVMRTGVTYKLGAKPPLDAKAGEFGSSDCSGYIRWLLHQFGAQVVDGSFLQHDQINRAGFKLSSASSGQLMDGVLRIAFLRPQDSAEGIGHVMLILNGRTMECCSSLGVGSRSWLSRPWMKLCNVYVLTRPQG